MSESLGEFGAARIGYIGPLLSPAEASSLPERQRKRLYAQAARDCELLPIDRLLAVIDTLAHLNDGNSLGLLTALAGSGDTRPGADDVRTAAEQLRAVLVERTRYAREARTLLRAANGPNPADTLLRPAPGAPPCETGKLLRPAVDVAAPAPGAPPKENP